MWLLRLSGPPPTLPTRGARALSGHLVLRDGLRSDARAVVDRVGRDLHDRFGIEHATLQVETSADGRGCTDCA